MKKILILFLLSSCVKQNDEVIPTYQWDKYQLIIDHYTQDTILQTRVLWWQGFMYGDREMPKDDWFLNCNTMLIEHQYYLKNDVKIQKSKYPNQRPEKIDTNFNNYQIK